MKEDLYAGHAAHDLSLLTVPRHEAITAIVPPNIAYDLKYRKGQVQKQSIDDAKYNEMANLRVYAGCKFLMHDPKSQQKYLAAVCLSISEGTYAQDSAALFTRFLKDIPADAEVEATKFNFVNRVGPKLYAERWATMAQDLYKTECIPLLQAHSGILGLPQFAELLPENRTFGVVFKNEGDLAAEHPVRGFLITRLGNDWSVEPFHESSNLLDLFTEMPPVLVVHTRNDGTKFESIARSFQLGPGLTPFKDILFFDMVAPHEDSEKIIQIANPPRPSAGNFIKELRWRASQIFDRAPKHDHSDDSFFILPSGVRYELQYNKGRVTAETLSQLVSPELTESVIYLATKMLDRSPEAQHQFIEEAARCMIPRTGDPSGFREQLRGIRPALLSAFKAANVLPKEDVVAGKLSLISRMGPTLFSQCWAEAIKKIRNAGEMPCLVGYAGLTGFARCAYSMPENDSFLIFVPNKDEPQRSFGYIIKREDTSVNVSRFDNETDLRAIIGDRPVGVIDDAAKSGNTLRFVHRFFKDNAAYPKISSLYCIDRVL